MAGNIIPAIATTNAVIAGLIVLEGMKILSGKPETCKTTYLNRRPNPKKRLLVPCILDKPNPKCYVCSDKPEVSVRLNAERMTVRTLEERVIKAALNMVAPDVEISDGRGTILISSEEGETTRPSGQWDSGQGWLLRSVQGSSGELMNAVRRVNIPGLLGEINHFSVRV